MNPLSRVIKVFILRFLAITLAVQPILILSIHTTPVAQAAKDENIGDATCLASLEQYLDRGELPTELLPDTGKDEVVSEADDPNLSPEEKAIYESINDQVFPQFYYLLNLKDLRSDTNIPSNIRSTFNTDYAIQQVKDYGNAGAAYYRTKTNLSGPVGSEFIAVCQNARSDLSMYQAFSPSLPISIATQKLTSLLENPNPKITFRNPIDRAALLGETCKGGLVGQQQDWSDENPACPGFDQADDIFANGVWDAPKVDQRVLRALVYLVTPVAEGGAGREHIRIKKIVQFSKSDEISVSNVDQTAVDEASAEDDGEQDPRVSGHYVGDALRDPPYRPEAAHLAQAVDIDEIDNLRVTQKVVVTQKTLISSSKTTTYTATPPTPIKVANQTDKGTGKDDGQQEKQDILGMSRTFGNQAIVALLEQFGLDSLSLNVREMDAVGYGDVSLLIGRAILERALGLPSGSLVGLDVPSVLQNIGRLYSEQQLGLLPGSLNTSSDDPSTIVSNIGRVTVEAALKLPAGSLKSSSATSEQLLESLGRTYLEKTVFRVSEGTLRSAANAPLINVGDLLARLGEGRMEEVFELPAGSTRVATYNELRAAINKAVPYLIDPARAGNPTKDDYTYADLFATRLGLEFSNYQNTGKNMYGFSKDEFVFPSIATAGGRIALERLKQLIGSRVIEMSVGFFAKSGTAERIPSEKVGTPEERDSVWVTNPPNPKQQYTTGKFYKKIYGLDAARRPVSDSSYGKLGRSGTWCGAQDTTIYPFFGSDPAKVPDTNTAIKNLKNYEGLSFGSVGFFGGFGGFGKTFVSNMGCSDQSKIASVNVDLRPLDTINDLLIRTQPSDRIDYINKDKAPKFTDFSDNEKIPDNFRNAAYNLATLFFYNDGRNQVSIPKNYVLTNTIAPDQTAGAATTDDSDTVAATTLPQVHLTCPVSAPLNQPVSITLRSWDPTNAGQKSRVKVTDSATGPGTTTAYPAGGGFAPVSEYKTTFTIQEATARTTRILSAIAENENGQKSRVASCAITFSPFTVREILNDLRTKDSSLNARLDMINNLYTAQAASNPFNLTPLLDLAGGALNQELVSRSNLITVRPRSTTNRDAFLTEYNDPSLNGWLFTISDLQRRITCIANGSEYKLTQADNGVYLFDCDGKSTSIKEETKEDSVELKKLRGANELLKSLKDQLQRMRDSMLKSLQTGALYEQPDGLATQSGYSVGLDLPSTSLPVDAYGRLVNTPRFSRDLIRTLVAPLTAGSINQPVALNASIAPFFAPIDAGSTGFIEIGRIQLAKQLSEDVFAQQSIATGLLTGYSGVLANLASGNIAQTTTAAQQWLVDQQVAEQKILDGGLDQGDLARLFMLDAGAQTFTRIGQEELVRTLFNRAGSNAAVRGRKDRLLVNRQSKQLGQSLGFYREHLATIRNEVQGILNDTASAPLADVPGARFADTRTRLQSLLTSLATDAATAPQLQALARHFDPFVTLLTRHAAAGTTASGLVDRLGVLSTALTEMASGRELYDAFVYQTSERKDGAVKQNKEVSNTESFKRYADASQFLQVSEVAKLLDQFSSAADQKVETGYGSYSYRLGSFTTWTGARVLENVLTSAGVGGFYAWYSLGLQDKNWSEDKLNLALGYAASGEPKPDDFVKLSQNRYSSEEKTRFSEAGKKIFANSIQTQIYQVLPYGGDKTNDTLTPPDFIAVLQGDIRPIMWKVGAANLDFAFNIKQGVTRQLISPSCNNQAGTEVSCSATSNQPWTDPGVVRDTILAREGMKRIGQAIPEFPQYFNLVQQGNAYQNWGNAVLTERLGLSANSFNGTIGTPCSNPADQTIRCKNSVGQILRSFGIGKTPFEQYFAGVRSKLSNLLFTNDLAKAIPLDKRNALLKEFDTQVNDNFLAKVTIDRLINDRAGFWVDSDPTRRTAEANKMARSDAEAFFTNGVLQALWSLPKNTDYSVPAGLATEIRRILLEKVGAADQVYKSADIGDLSRYLTQDSMPLDFFNTDAASYESILGQSYLTRIGRFQDRTNNLGGTYVSSISSFLKGNALGEAVSSALGVKQINDQNILVTLFDTNLRTINAEWARTAIANFGNIISNGGFCNGTVKTGEFLTNLLRGGYDQPFSRCAGLGARDGFGGDLAKFLFDPSTGTARDLVLDKFLSMGLSLQIEQGLGLQPGMLKTMILDPKQAPVMLLTQGITKVTEKLFGDINFADSCRTNGGSDALGLGCMAGQVINDLKNALLTGFYDSNAPPGKEWSMTFNNQRFNDAFTEIKNNAVDRILGRVTREYLGFEISRAELDAIMKGDTQTITDLGLQFLMNTLNSRLGGDSMIGRVVAIIGQTWAQYRSLHDVGSLSTEDLALSFASGSAGMRDQIINAVCGALSGEALAACRGLSSTELVDKYKTIMEGVNKKDIDSLLRLSDDFELLKQLKDSPLAMFINFGAGDIRGQLRNINTLDAAGVILAQQLKDTFNITVQQEFTNRKFFAQSNLQAIALNIVASKFSLALPADFAQRLFGTSTERSMAIGDLAMSLLTKADSPLGKILRDAGISSTQIIELGRCFLSGNSTDQQNALKNLFSTAGLLNTLDNKLASFLTENLGIAGLPDGMLSSFVAWGIHGFKGSDFNKDINLGGIDIKSFGSFINDVGPQFLTSFADKQFGLKPGTSQQLINAYKAIQAYQKALSGIGMTAAERAASLKAATAGLIQIGLSLVLNYFGETLTKLDQQLGLPPGTLALALQIGVNALLASINPAFANPIGIYIAVFFYLNSLFGSVTVDIDVKGTGDGYYPYYSIRNEDEKVSGFDPEEVPILYGMGEATPWINATGSTKANDHYGEVLTPDPLLGEFDAKNPATYRAALQEIARNKVRGVIVDLLRMPYSDWAFNKGFTSFDTQIIQAFTYGGGDFDPLQDSGVAQALNLSGTMQSENFGGYGWAKLRCPNYQYDESTATATCKPTGEFRAGWWPDPRFTDNIHLRW